RRRGRDAEGEPRRDAGGEAVLAAARSRRAPAPDVPPYAAPYAAQVATLDALLAELAPGDWSTIVIYDWTVQDVVAHLAAVDRLLHEQLRNEHPGPGPTGGEADVDARTASTIAFERTRTPEQTRTAWRAEAHALCAGLPTAGEERREVRLRFPAPLDGAFVARAFETWVHSADIAAAVGRSVPDPLPRHLHAMADLGVRSLPVALAIRSGGAEGAARVVLDGPGGGEWLVPLGGDGAEAEPVVTLELGVMEFCLLAADRREPGAVRAGIGGDVALGRRLLESASAFAGP
ncbi:maleylpyruvate isomerase family mycothiol-dependent enzyme, partial [Spirillospora sp. NPDC029432]|uniref:maleylpyruvate isomerase family mycothiol-dependent enzyme n=1 Tax=Spirillospora sp. NPDC029432 TaxID=3154599 RepID=UPI0034512022